VVRRAARLLPCTGEVRGPATPALSAGGLTMPKLIGLLTVATLAALSLAGSADAADYPFVFKDVGDDAGVIPHVAGIRGHGVAWADVEGDGWPDLFAATFHNNGSKPSVFLRNDKGKFRLDPQEHLRTSGIGSGALFADLTNSGRLDLYVSN